MELNQDKLNEFLGRAVVDFGATLHAGLVVIGEKLGLYKALASADGPLTPDELAKKTGTVCWAAAVGRQFDAEIVGRATGMPAGDMLAALEHALELANRDQDHWHEWLAVWRLAKLALDQGDAEAALRHCERRRPLAAKMKGGSEAVRSEAVHAVALSLAGQRVDLDAALGGLRAIDSKSDLAWVLCYLARLDPKRAHAYATEALAAAEAVGRESEIVVARRILGLTVKSSRDISARARQFLKETPHGRTRARAIV